jgi:hypothetical protein
MHLIEFSEKTAFNMNLKELACDGVDCIQLAPNWNQCQALVNTITVKRGYSNIGFCDTLSIASNIQWYELIPHKATVFIPCLVRHAQIHQPRM